MVSLKELWLGAIPTCTLNEEIGTHRPNAPFLNHFFLLLSPSKARGMSAISPTTSLSQSPKSHSPGTYHYVPGSVQKGRDESHRSHNLRELTGEMGINGTPSTQHWRRHEPHHKRTEAGCCSLGCRGGRPRNHTEAGSEQTEIRTCEGKVAF